MKLFINLTKPYLSNALRRVEEGLEATKPLGLKLVYKIADADIVITPTVNVTDFTDYNWENKKNVVLNLCYLTGGTKEQWQEIWNKANFIASYYKLPTDYLRIPLGYDPTLFYKENVPKIYEVMATGYVDGEMGEAIKEAYYAARRFGKFMHVGENFYLGDGYTVTKNVSDLVMARLYNSSKFVTGLRYVEGFELPVIEGGACGAVPIVFDMECYRHWYNGKAVFIDPKENVEKQISETIRSYNYYLKNLDLDYTMFTWDNVMPKFWEGVLSG